MAGEPGDRWLRREMLGGSPASLAQREESPDTIVVGSQEPVTN